MKKALLKKHPGAPMKSVRPDVMFFIKKEKLLKKFQKYA